MSIVPDTELNTTVTSRTKIHVVDGLILDNAAGHISW